MRLKCLSTLLVFALLLGGCAGGDSSTDSVTETRFLMDTVCTITVFGTRDRSIISRAFDYCAEYEALFSISVEGSDIWRINRAGGELVTVSPLTADLLRLGVYYGELSGGSFDITIGRLSSLWDFTGQAVIPSAAEIEFARGTVDFRKIVIEGNTAQLLDPEARLDLGGIAKGFIADRLADWLRESAVIGAVVDLGGDIAVVGEKPDGSPWRIGVRQPFAGRADLLGAVELGESAIVSSGVYERQFEVDGVLFHHILDPGTGLPVISDVISATVVSESAVIGDILSTIVILAGSGGAAGFLSDAPGFVGALIVLDNGELLQFGDIMLLT